jgi:deoxyribodipyrimidine photo-lyase
LIYISILEGGSMEDRVKRLNEAQINLKGKYVAYWMQTSQRVDYNHSLEYAVMRANHLKKPLVILFNLMDDYPEANYRHYFFMLEGLREVRDKLKSRKIEFHLLYGNMVENILEISKDAVLLICDKGYLCQEKKWRREISKKAGCEIIEVESNLIVPIEAVSNKEEYSARTIRNKINRIVDNYLYDFQKEKYELSSSKEVFSSKLDITDKLGNIEKLADSLKINKDVGRTPYFKGGSKEGKKRLRVFIEDKLEDYSEKSSNPGEDFVSKLSPYLHFGNISPIEIVQEVLRGKNIQNKESVDSFLEELIVRRELAFNFIYFNDKYNEFEGISYPWAYDSLEKHSKDLREYLYTLDELEIGDTHDEYWNAAQKEMVKTGFMQGYMRMYWCKKILEWSLTPKVAYEKTIYLNNKYLLDGRDPNSYAGVAWCFGKHDRAWKERAIFGKVRYMNYNGLKRKFNMDKYLERIELLGD